ncbi:MAG TPA: molybdate ABC transporter permease subunit [Candidatus Binatia bacterium]|nr:molybdate ABC transporter permease subunit [Candidatus Binatia bacterium]
MDWEAIGLSVRLAAATTLILVVLGLPFAWWLARTAVPWRPFVEALVALPLVLPPTVLGFYLLLALGPAGPLGVVWSALGGGRLVFSFEGLLVASVVYSLPFAVQPFAVAFAGLDRSLIETAWTLGRSRLATFVTVALPLARGGILTGVVLAFAHTLGEFGVVLMVGGNLPGETRTVSIAIYDRVQALDYAGASATALPLLVVSFLVLAATYALRGGMVLPLAGRRAGERPVGGPAAGRG